MYRVSLELILVVDSTYLQDSQGIYVPFHYLKLAPRQSRYHHEAEYNRICRQGDGA